MSEKPDIPPNGGGNPPPVTFVSVAFTTPATAPLFVGIPFTVQGTAFSEPAGNVTGVSLSFDGAAVTVVDDAAAHNWSSWHAVVTATSAGTHNVLAVAAGLGKTDSSSLQLTASPVLSCPAAGASGVISTSELSVVLGVQVNASTFAPTAAGWQYQLSGGPWTAPAHITQPSSSSWQLTIALPAAAAAAAGTSYPLQVRATTAQGQSATLALTVQAVDTSPPALLSLTVPGNAVAGTTPAVSLQVSDQVAGAVFSGIPANGVTVQFDGQAVAVTHTSGTDPSVWSATLPAVTHAAHQVTIAVKDAAGNTTTAPPFSSCARAAARERTFMARASGLSEKSIGRT